MSYFLSHVVDCESTDGRTRGAALQGGWALATGDEVIVSFTQPPVVEVIAGVAFDGLPVEGGAHLAAFWASKLRPQFPNMQLQAPYFPPAELFGGTPEGAMSVLQLGSAAPLTRYWAADTDEQELLQLQPGWFACNWRKVQPEGGYDRWPRRRQAFAKWWDQLQKYCEEEGVAKLRPTQYEVSYINHIKATSVWSSHAEAGAIFRLSMPNAALEAFETFAAELRFTITDDEPLGRLHVRIAPAFDRDGRPLYLFELTARGPVNGEDQNTLLTTMDRGREAIVRAFLDLTTPEAQEEWGKR